MQKRATLVELEKCCKTHARMPVFTCKITFRYSRERARQKFANFAKFAASAGQPQFQRETLREFSPPRDRAAFERVHRRARTLVKRVITGWLCRRPHAVRTLEPQNHHSRTPPHQEHPRFNIKTHTFLVIVLINSVRIYYNNNIKVRVQALWGPSQKDEFSARG